MRPTKKFELNGAGSEQTLDAAHHWVARLETAEEIDAVWPEFESWLHAERGNREAVRLFEEAARRMDRLSELRGLDEGVDPDLLATETRASQGVELTRSASTWGGVAAAIALVGTLVIGGYWWWTLYAWKSCETAVGDHALVLLDDGSLMKLNTNTKVRYRLTRVSRQIVLERGEALFTVEHDARRPFDVLAGGVIVRDIGTAFDVRIRDNQNIDVMVQSGLVTVAPGRENTRTLAEGEVARLSPNGFRVENLGEQSINRRLLWQEGTLSFAGETLDEVVAEVNRYNRVQLVIDDPGLSKRQIAGSFPADDSEGFVMVLRKYFGVRVRTDLSSGGKVIRLTGRSSNDS
jgi:transmembrane sensor